MFLFFFIFLITCLEFRKGLTKQLLVIASDVSTLAPHFALSEVHKRAGVCLFLCVLFSQGLRFVAA